GRGGQHAAAEGLVAAGDGVGVGDVGGGDRAVEVGVVPHVVAAGPGGDGVLVGQVPVTVGVRVARGQREGHAVGRVLHPLDHAPGVGQDRRHVRPPVLAIVATLLQTVVLPALVRRIAVAQDHAVDGGRSAEPAQPGVVIDEDFLGVRVAGAEGGDDPPGLVVAEPVPRVAAVHV